MSTESQAQSKGKSRLFIVLGALLGVAVLLLAVFWFMDSGRGRPKRDPQGPLVVLAPAGAVEQLAGLAQNVPTSRGVRVVAADGTRQLALAESDPEGTDIYLIAGESQKAALIKRGLFERLGPAPLLYDRLEAITRVNSTIELTFPQHLLQPVVKGVAALPLTDAFGELTRHLLDGWQLTDRLGGRLIPVANATEALRKLAAGEISVAFIPRSERLQLGALTPVLNLARHPQAAVPLYAFVSLNSPHLAEARALGAALTSPQALQRLNERVFLPREKQPGLH